jgi:hypothetical protein
LGHIIGKDMKAPNSRVLISIVIFLAVSGLHAQNTLQPAYLKQALSPQQRAADLVRRMTVEEKVSQLVNQSRAVIIAEGKYSMSVGGGQPNTEAPSVSGATDRRDARFENCSVRSLAISYTRPGIGPERAGWQSCAVEESRCWIRLPGVADLFGIRYRSG